MRILIGRNLIFLTLLAAFFFGGDVKAQTFALPFDLIQSTPALDFAVDANGNLLDRGPYTGTGAMAPVTTAAGPMFLWSPSYGIFRAGYFSYGTAAWNSGINSIGLGYVSWVSGQYATIIQNGGGSSANRYSVAIGLSSGANGNNSTVFTGLTSATNAISISGGNAAGIYSFSTGQYSASTGSYSIAAGQHINANGNFASALGCSDSANGANSMAFGYGGTSNAVYSYASGMGTLAGSYGAFVTGTNNFDLSEGGAAPSPTVWVTTDPIFEVGNAQGTGSIPKATALVIYKNGDAAFPSGSKVTAAQYVVPAASGDIPTYTGN